MLIDLQNKVIILDEAHNIEDCARDAASLTINSEELAEVTKEINDIGTWYINLLCYIASPRKHPCSNSI